jgi:hypothetical protein
VILVAVEVKRYRLKRYRLKYCLLQRFHHTHTDAPALHPRSLTSTTHYHRIAAAGDLLLFILRSAMIRDVVLVARWRCWFACSS